MDECWTTSRSVSADVARGSGPEENDCDHQSPARGRKKRRLSKKSLTDPVYRAAILTARDIDTDSDPTRASAGVAMATSLERHGVKLSTSLKPLGKTIPGVLEVEGGEGIVISVPGDERPTDWTATARQNRWRQTHLIHFAPKALSIKTVAV